MASPQELAELARKALARWRDDPVLFAREALGIERIWHRQEELLRAVALHRKVAVKSGQKTSKTFSIAIIAIWWAMTRPRARVFLMSPSHRQIKENLWTDLTRIREDTYITGERRRAPMPLGGDFHIDPETGWELPNKSKIVGFTTIDPEKLRGLSGADNFYILDEASGIVDEIYGSIDGNLAGGGRVLAISNPVHSQGWYRSCFAEGSRWHQLTITSIEASEVEPPISGLATKEFLEEKRTEWGVDSPEWSAKVLGEFPPVGIGGFITRDRVEAAMRRRSSRAPKFGDLQIGVDVGGNGTDPSAIVWRRGSWVSDPIVLFKADDKTVAGRAMEIVDEQCKPNERPKVLVDGTSIGAGVVSRLRDHSDRIEVVDIQAAGSSPDKRCSRMRDALWIYFSEWLGTGALPYNLELLADLTAPTLGFDRSNLWKVEDKDRLRRKLRRSTDIGDAALLAVYQAPTRGDFDDIILGGGRRKR